MIAYIGYAGRKARFARSHASVATASVALTRARGDLLQAVRILLDAPCLVDETMRLITLDSHRVPRLPAGTGALAVMADLETNQLEFFAPIGWQSTAHWGHVGGLSATAKVSLDDVEAIESMLYMAFRPVRGTVRRTGYVRAVRT